MTVSSSTATESPDPYTIALAQTHIEGGAIEDNRSRALEAIEHAAQRGVDLVALPELFSVGYFAFDRYERHAEGLEGETLTEISAAAADHDIAVLAGSIVEDLGATQAETPAESGLANTSVLFNSSGERVLVYRKHHLFGYDSAESELLVPGEALEVADVGPFSVAVTTCYDLRFPELYREFVDKGATLVLVPSAWPYPRVDHWETLARVRAIENQWYLATINGSGSFDVSGSGSGEDSNTVESQTSTLLGRSTVYDPWGVPVASSGDDPALVMTELDPTRVDEVRSEFPALCDRRL